MKQSGEWGAGFMSLLYTAPARMMLTWLKKKKHIEMTDLTSDFQDPNSNLHSNFSKFSWLGRICLRASEATSVITAVDSSHAGTFQVHSGRNANLLRNCESCTSASSFSTTTTLQEHTAHKSFVSSKHTETLKNEETHFVLSSYQQCLAHRQDKDLRVVIWYFQQFDCPT